MRHPAARFPLFLFLVCARLVAGCSRVPFFAPPPPRVVLGGCCRRAAVLPFSPCFLVSAVGRLRAVAAAGRAPPSSRAGFDFVVACLLLLFSGARAACCPCSPPAVSAACPLPNPSSFVLRGCCRPAAWLLLRSVWVVSVGCCPSCPPLTPRFVFRGCGLRALCAHPACFVVPVCLLFVCAWCCPPPFVVVSVSRASSPLFLCVSACCFGRSGVRCTLLCCTMFCCPSCKVWCRLVLLWAAVCCVLSLGALCCGGVWCGAVGVAVSCCCVLCCAFGPGLLLRSVLFASSFLCRLGLFFCVLCCAASLGAVQRCVASCCSVSCPVAVHCVVCLVPCCFSSLFCLLLRAVLCPRVLCVLLRAVLCYAVLLCVVLRLGV